MLPQSFPCAFWFHKIWIHDKYQTPVLCTFLAGPASSQGLFSSLTSHYLWTSVSIIISLFWQNQAVEAVLKAIINCEYKFEVMAQL